MAALGKMAKLGRRGGLSGGRARARVLSASRRSEIARQAARARWSRPVLSLQGHPRDPGELAAFVAHHGTRVSTASGRHDLEDIALRALEASRHDPSLARMLPVFLWRARRDLNLPRLAREAMKRDLGPSLGYFLELTAGLGAGKGRWNGYRATLATLRAHAKGRPPFYFFPNTAKHPFEAMVADESTPPGARAWGLITGTPTDSFETYFRKASVL